MNDRLETVSQAFETWRRSREGRTHTPQNLIAKAVALRKSYSDAEIVRTLKINKSALMRWSEQSVIDAPAFVELPTVTDTQATMNTCRSKETSTLELGLPSGVSLSLSGTPCVLADFVVQLSQKGAL